METISRGDDNVLFNYWYDFPCDLGAYYCVSLSFNEDKVIEKWTGLWFTNGRTELKILLVFALYLIGLKILCAAVYKYETAPPKKLVPVDWEAEQPTEKP